MKKYWLVEGDLPTGMQLMITPESHDEKNVLSECYRQMSDEHNKLDGMMANVYRSLKISEIEDVIDETKLTTYRETVQEDNSQFTCYVDIRHLDINHLLTRDVIKHCEEQETFFTIRHFKNDDGKCVVRFMSIAEEQLKDLIWRFFSGGSNSIALDLYQTIERY